MKRFLLFSFIVFLTFGFHLNSVKACLHFTESFTSPYIPQTYTTGTVTLSSGNWDLTQVRGDLAANTYGGAGGAARLAKNMTAFMISPSVNSVGTISFYYRTLNTGSGTFKIQKSVNGGAYTDIATQSFTGQTYTLFSITVNDASNNIRIKILSDNNNENLIVDEVTINVYDVTAPNVIATAQTVNNTGQTVQVQSSEADGFVYIIKTGVTQTTQSDMDNAVTNLQGAKTAVTAANTDMNISALNLQAGNYHAYAVDCPGNISTMGTNIIQVGGSSASITSVAFANGNYIIGSAIAITITATSSGFTAGTINVNGHAITGFTDNGNNTYSGTYTVIEGDNDAAQLSDVNFSIVLMNGVTPTAAFTGPATGTVTIDAHRPLINTSVRISNTQIKLTTNELLNSASITQLNDGGFVVSDLNNSSIHYTVTAVNHGTFNSEILLTVNDFFASSVSGLTVTYSHSGNGNVLDAAGNYMASNPSIPAINPWSGTGLSEIVSNSENIIGVYPNPAKDFVNISANGFVSGSDMAIYSVDGQLMFSVKITDGLTKQFNVANMAKGIYLIRVSDNENMAWSKLIVE